MTTAPRRTVAELVDGEAPPRTSHGLVLLDRPATLADLDRLPPTWRGEIIHGALWAFPRPRARHQRASGQVFAELRDPYDRGRGGPGGWWILIEPGIQLPSAAEFSPDIAGWRRETMPEMPRKGAITTAPDWLCEVMSPSTRTYDHAVKRRFYAEIGVSYLWYIDPVDRLLVASKLEDGRWVELGAWKEDDKVRTEPFEAMELELAALWEGFEDEQPSPSPPSVAL